MTRTEPVAAESPPADSPPPRIEPKLDARWALRLPQLLMVAGVAAAYLVVSYLPLTAPELWNAVNYGDWILEHRQLPTSDWIMPFAEGMPVVDTQWASEVLLAKAAAVGDSWLTTLAGVLVATTLMVLGRAYWLLTRSATTTLLVAAAVLAMAWTRYTALRPEHFGLLCLALLLWWRASVRLHVDASGGRWAIRSWLAVALLFVAWANLHASVVWGLVVMSAWAVGAAIDAWRREPSLAGVLGDGMFQRHAFALELAAVAACWNPYGLDLLLEIAWYARSANLAELADWQPLVLLRSAGPGFALSIVALVALLRASRTPLAAADVLALGAATVGVVLHQWQIGLYAPLFGFLVAPPLADVLQRRWPQRDTAKQDAAVDPATGEPSLPPGRAWTYTLLAALAVWVAFSLSDASRPLLGGKPRTPEQLYGASAPLGLAAYLEQHPPRDTVFAPAGWGDWLYRQSHRRVQPFATSRIEVLPRQAWIDYSSVASAQSGWRNVLRRYVVRTMIVDRNAQPALATGLRLDPEWEPMYQDAVSLLFTASGSTSAGTAQEDTDD